MKKSDLELICKGLEIPGDIIGISMLSSGHINTTIKVDTFFNGKNISYIIQRINTNVFANPEKLMNNILSVTKFIENQKGENKNPRTLKFLLGKNKNGFVEVAGNFYRGYEFVENSETYDLTDNDKIVYETGFAFGEFQKMLKNYPADKLFETIPNFHNTINRFEDFETAIALNPKGRLENVKPLVEQYKSLSEPATEMYKKWMRGELPLRVTHNDTKSNNVLFDKKTKKYICVIDLDTVMPGLAGFDFGDGIRFIANTATEDEKDLSKVSLDLNKFKNFTQGFLDGAGNSFSKQEIETLPLGALTMTAECGVRFLTDYINGDTYFKIEYPEHNLDRAKCQLKLAESMIEKYSGMQKIVDECANGYQKTI